MASQPPVVLLAAHGERGGAANNARLAQLVDQVGALLPEADVGSVLVNVEGVVEAAMKACGPRPVVVLPLLFSDGFFMEQRLRPFVAGKAQALAQPLALWPSFAPFLADNLALRLISRSADPRVVLVAHGSKQSGPSAVAARSIATRLSARYGRVEVGFLEEAPFAADVIAGIEPPYATVGLFFGAGLHGTEDFDVLVSDAPHLPEAAFTVGELPGLAGLVAEEARRMLGKLG
jgi:sirohydrochlorin ferrochelatase